MTSVAGSPVLFGGLAEKGSDISGRAVEGKARGRRRMDDECGRHQRDSHRPGQAGSAAAERARLMKELAGLRNALALTRRLLGDGDDAPVAKDAASLAIAS